MPSGKYNDKKLAEFRREITELKKLIAKQTDPKAKAFREGQLARTQQQMAKYLQNKPE